MSTEYKITGLVLPSEEYISIDEHSNKLDLVLNTRHKTKYIIKDMTPSQLVLFAIQCIKVASYWMDEEELLMAVRSYVYQENLQDDYLSALLAKIGAL